MRISDWSSDVGSSDLVEADEDVCQAKVTLQVLQEVQHLRLDRHVGRGDRLVADHELGPKRGRAGDADALALPAGEAMRVAPDVLAVEADQAHQLLDDTLALAGRADAVDGQRLGQNFTDGHARVQRGEGILENELNLLAELPTAIAAQRKHVDIPPE